LLSVKKWGQNWGGRALAEFLMAPLWLFYCSFLTVFFGAAHVLAEDRKISCDAVPAFLRHAFADRFPTATPLSCVKDVEQHKTRAYDINAQDGPIKRKVSLSPEGTLLTIEETIRLADVPDSVKHAIKLRYPDGVITIAEKVTYPVYAFELFVRDQGKLLQVAVDPGGTKVSEVKD
jgi:hypothetical protein